MPEHRDTNGHLNAEHESRRRRAEVIDVLTEALWTLICRGEDPRRAAESGRSLTQMPTREGSFRDGSTR